MTVSTASRDLPERSRGANEGRCLAPQRRVAAGLRSASQAIAVATVLLVAQVAATAAEKSFDEVLHGNPDGAYIYLEGSLKLEAGLYSAALERFERALKVLGDSPEVLLSAARAAEGAGMKQRARALSERAMGGSRLTSSSTQAGTALEELQERVRSESRPAEESREANGRRTSEPEKGLAAPVLFGRVVSERGQPVAGAKVCVLWNSTGRLARRSKNCDVITFSGPDGQFRLGLVGRIGAGVELRVWGSDSRRPGFQSIMQVAEGSESITVRLGSAN